MMLQAARKKWPPMKRIYHTYYWMIQEMECCYFWMLELLLDSLQLHSVTSYPQYLLTISLKETWQNNLWWLTNPYCWFALTAPTLTDMLSVIHMLPPAGHCDSNMVHNKTNWPEEDLGTGIVSIGVKLTELSTKQRNSWLEGCICFGFIH
jgi:hypothetical protein